MGLFKFIMDAGAKLESMTHESPKERDEETASALLKAVEKMGIAVEGLKISFDRGTAKVGGKTKTQADREKIILAIGNHQGVSEVDDDISVEGKEPEAVMYTVKKGDSLSKIAKEHYGDAMKYPLIFEANKPMLTDPNKIYPNQVLRIPSVE